MRIFIYIYKWNVDIHLHLQVKCGYISTFTSEMWIYINIHKTNSQDIFTSDIATLNAVDLHKRKCITTCEWDYIHKIHSQVIHHIHKCYIECSEWDYIRCGTCECGESLECMTRDIYKMWHLQNVSCDTFCKCHITFCKWDTFCKCHISCDTFTSDSPHSQVLHWM